MNPQTAQPDITLDRILSALRNTPAPTGMNQRIAARIAMATEQRAATPSFFAVILSAVKDPRILPAQATRYLFAATTLAALLAVSAISFTAHRKPSTISLQKPSPASRNPQTSTQPNTTTAAIKSNPSTLASTTDTASNPRAGGPPYTSVGRSPTFASTTTRGPEARSIDSAPASTDLDALALAETLAPSHPAPPMPLTAEEHLLLLATRPGQPIELAELETLRQPALQARAQAREQATIRNYIHSLLGPLAAAEAIHPTPPMDDSPTSPPSSR
jgi:hypothetical protein